MESLREQREQLEQDVVTAAREEHEAWLELEREARNSANDEAAVERQRERWRATARALAAALEALKRRN